MPPTEGSLLPSQARRLLPVVALAVAVFLASGWIELFSSHHLLKPGHEGLQVSLPTFSHAVRSQPRAVTNKERVSERIK